KSGEFTFEQLLDSDEAASLLKIHPKTLQKMARNGEIAGVQVGRLWRFRASVLNEWLEHKMVSSSLPQAVAGMLFQRSVPPKKERSANVQARTTPARKSSTRKAQIR